MHLLAKNILPEKFWIIEDDVQTKLGTIQVDTANIANAAISTAKIGDNQVTLPEFVTGQANIIVTSSTYQTVATLTTTQSGAPAQVLGMTTVTHTNTSAQTIGNQYGVFSIRLLDSLGTSLIEFIGTYVGGINAGAVILPKLTTYTGSRTFYLQVKRETTSSAARILVLQPAISYLELKK